MKLPVDANQVFFETLYGEKSVLEFEEWLYANKQLENILKPGDYLDLISFGYKGRIIKHDLDKLLEKHIDPGEYESWKLTKLLSKALKADHELPRILILFYDLYCRGYYFLDNIALGYGLGVKVPYPDAGSWDELSEAQQKEMLSNFYPGLTDEINKVLGWLDSEKIILTGIKDENEHYGYIDNRPVNEIYPTAYKRALDDSGSGKPWWKFW